MHITNSGIYLVLCHVPNNLKKLSGIWYIIMVPGLLHCSGYHYCILGFYHVMHDTWYSIIVMLHRIQWLMH